MPLSMNVGVPDDPKLAKLYDEYGQYVDWFLVLEFNRTGVEDYVSLSHAENDQAVLLAKIPDSDGAIAREILDFNDDDPEGFADRLLNRLYDLAGKRPPQHAGETFQTTVADWTTRWRERAAQEAESPETN